MGYKKDLTGKIFGRLKVIRDSGKKAYGSIVWECICCGSYENQHAECLVNINANNLLSGGTKSCGCLQKEKATKHGLSKYSEYHLYYCCKSRCENSNDLQYKYYGERGIKFLFTSVEDFYQELGSKPSKNYSIDRINNNGNYEPGNIRWASMEEQNQNQRTTKLDPDKVRYIRFIGNELSVKYLTRKFNCSQSTIRDVLNYKTWKNIK